MKLTGVAILFLLSHPVLGQNGDTECLPAGDRVEFGDYWFELGFSSGAKGDVVGLTLTLDANMEFPEGASLNLSVCHGPALLELVGEPDLSEEFAAMVRGSLFCLAVDESDEPENHRGHGFVVVASKLDTVALNARVSEGIPFPLLTAYYRLRGDPGEVAEVSFCDNRLELSALRCHLNEFLRSRSGGPIHILPSETANGAVAVVEGPSLQPDRPPKEPEAKVYLPPLSTAEANLSVLVGDSLARPGDQNVPIPLFVAADVEYTGIILSIDFDERYLRLSRVENRLRAGFTLIDNDDQVAGAGPEEGNVVIATPLTVGDRRYAEEGEEIHAATLYFDVSQTAPDMETQVNVTPVIAAENRTSFEPVIFARVFSENASGEEIAIPVGFSPFSVTAGAVEIRRSLSTFRGDLNLDGVLDLTDAIALLGHLFLANVEPRCLAAADVDGDGRVSIGDPITILTALFLGDPPVEELKAEEVPCG